MNAITFLCINYKYIILRLCCHSDRWCMLSFGCLLLYCFSVSVYGTSMTYVYVEE